MIIIFKHLVIILDEHNTILIKEELKLSYYNEYSKLI